MARSPGARPRQPPRRHGLVQGVRRERRCHAVRSGALALLGRKRACGGRPPPRRGRTPIGRPSDAGSRQSAQRSSGSGADERRHSGGRPLSSGGVRALPRARRRLGCRLFQAYGRLFNWAGRRLAESAGALRRKRARVPPARRSALRTACGSSPRLGSLRARRPRTSPHAVRSDHP
jgi:hypothetical protein